MNHNSTLFVTAGGAHAFIPSLRSAVRYRTNVGSRFRNSLSWKDEEVRWKIQGDLVGRCWDRDGTDRGCAKLRITSLGRNVIVSCKGPLI